MFIFGEEPYSVSFSVIKSFDLQFEIIFIVLYWPVIPTELDCGCGDVEAQCVDRHPVCVYACRKRHIHGFLTYLINNTIYSL